MTLSANFTSKSVFGQQGCRALTFALARLSCLKQYHSSKCWFICKGNKLIITNQPTKRFSPSVRSAFLETATLLSLSLASQVDKQHVRAQIIDHLSRIYNTSRRAHSNFEFPLRRIALPGLEYIFAFQMKRFDGSPRPQCDVKETGRLAGELYKLSLTSKPIKIKKN